MSLETKLAPSECVNHPHIGPLADFLWQYGQTSLNNGWSPRAAISLFNHLIALTEDPTRKLILKNYRDELVQEMHS